MRFLVLSVLVLLTLPATAQLRYTASPVEQRLDSAEQRLDTLESTVKQLATTNQQIVALLAQQQTKTVQPVVAKPAPQLISAQPVRIVQSTQPTQPVQSSYAALVRSHFPNGWRGEYADVSPRSAVWIHLRQHGFSQADIQGLDQNTALGLHALTHAGLVRPNSRAAAPQHTHTQENRVRTVAVQQMGGCANGQCARPGVNYSQRRSGVFGFGIFR